MARRLRLRGGHDLRVNGDPAALAAIGELDTSRDLREDGVVAAHSGTITGMELAPALAHDDRSGRNDLAGEDLHAESLRRGIVSVATGTATFLVCHLGLPLRD